MTMLQVRRQVRFKARGFSLIELMVAVVIGFVIIGAVLTAYVNSGLSGRSGQALSQMTEDASIAFNVLRSGISQVGYGRPLDFNPVSQRFTKAYPGFGIFGCDSKFTNVAVDIDQLACGGGGTTDSIAVAYEADVDNSAKSGANVPLDCLGNALNLIGTYYLNYSRYYVSDGQLFCRGPGSNTPQALVDNIVDMQVSYGIANRVVGNSNTYGVAYYDTATTMGAVDTNAWANTVAVRICLVVRSAEPALSKPMDYQGCNGKVNGVAGDLRAYRSFTSTIVLQNRLGAVL